jgi:phospholipid-binding lipoprotein MlaA
MRRFVLLVSFAVLLSSQPPPACAAPSRPRPAHAKGDPFEAFNRANFNSTRSLQKVLSPILALYRRLTPGIIGKGIHNVLVNLREPIVIVNDLLQLRVGRAGEAGARLAFNSTIGLAGLIDVAGAAGNPHHDNGFGNTLGHYGVGPGPYLFLPLLGPTDVRDIVGSGADFATSPLRYIKFPSDVTVNIGIFAVGGLDAFANSENQLDILFSESADPYASLRSAYLQNREAQIHGATTPTVLPDLGDPATPSPDPAAPPATPDLAPDAPASQPQAPDEAAALDAPIATAVL